MVNIKINKQGLTKRRACEITAEELQMSETAIKNHIRNYREYGVKGLYDRPRSGAPPIYDSDVIDATIADLEQKGRVTPRLLAAKVQELQGGERRMSVRHARRELGARRKSPKKAQHANVAAAKPHAVYRWRWIVLVVEPVVIYSYGGRATPIALPRQVGQPAASACRRRARPRCDGLVLCRIGGLSSPAGVMRDGDPTRPALFAADAPQSVRRRRGFHELFDPSGDPVPPVSPQQGVFPELCDDSYEIDQADLQYDAGSI